MAEFRDHYVFDKLESRLTNFGSASAEDLRTIGTDSIVIHVPTDFDTLDAAFTAASELVEPREGVTVDIVIESGHALDARATVENRNFRFVSVRSEDATVPLTADLQSESLRNIIEIGGHSAGPIWNVLLDCAGADSHGIEVTEQSSITVNSGYGVENAGQGVSGSEAYGFLVAHNSQFWGYFAVSRNCDRGVSIGNQSLGYANGAEFTNCRDYGVRSFGGGIQINDADLRGAGGAAIRTTPSTLIDASGATLSDANNPSQTAISTAGPGSVYAYNATGESCTGRSVRSRDGCHVMLRQASLSSDTGTDLEVRRGGTISADECTTTASTGPDPHANNMSVSPNTVNGEGIIFAESYEQ